MWLCVNWLCRWHEINNMSHNRSFFALELANREESVQFQTVSFNGSSTNTTLLRTKEQVQLKKTFKHSYHQLV